MKMQNAPDSISLNQIVQLQSTPCSVKVGNNTVKNCDGKFIWAVRPLLRLKASWVLRTTHDGSYFTTLRCHEELRVDKEGDVNVDTEATRTGKKKPAA